MRAFIFSLDAFVAFTLALIAIYSLIFFSSIPSSYYYLLTQGHYLAKDAATTLSSTDCEPYYRPCYSTGSLLDNLASVNTSASEREDLIKRTVGQMIPNQFGYRVEISADEGQSWSIWYDTLEVPDEVHTGKGKKVVVSSQFASFGYAGLVSREEQSPYRYLSCNAGDDSAPIITCGQALNVNPSGVEDMIPELATRLVRITVFI